MQLKRLKIRSLPGIEPGFTFEPAGAGVNIVTGPNAIGKSSLVRALGYLLRDGQRDDPLALSLQAEFESNGTAWRVLRNGSQVAWHRDGNPASPPVLPGAAQTGLYRLSMEQLLAGDARDSDLARELRNRLRGGFDLDEPRLELSLRFAQNEEKNLRNADKALRKAEEEYDDLERQEQETLPELSQEIKSAGEAQSHRDRLQRGLDLHDAISERESCAAALKAFPSGMDKLQGDEQERIAKLEKKSENQEDKLREQERLLKTAEAALEKTGLKHSEPDSGRLDAMELSLQQLGQKVERRSAAQDALVQADAGLNSAQKYFNDTGQAPCLDAQSLEQAEAIAVPLIKEQTRQGELQLKLEQAGDIPDEAEINKLYGAGSALRDWLAAIAAGSGPQPAPPDRRLRGALWIILAAGGLAALLAVIQQALPAAAAALASLVVAAWGLYTMRRRRPAAGSPADEAKQRFIRTGLAGPQDWSVVAVEEYLREEIEKRYNVLVLQRERAAQAPGIRAELEKVKADIAGLEARKREAAADLGFDPDEPSIRPDLFIQNCRQLAAAESSYEKAKAKLDLAQRDIAEDTAQVRDFLAPWRNAGAPALEDADEDQDINRLQVSFQDLKRRAHDAKDARREITSSQENIRSIRNEIEACQDEIRKVFTGCGLEPGARIELDRQLGLLDKWKAQQGKLQKAEFEEERIRTLLESHPEIIGDIEEGKVAKLQKDFAVASEQAGRHEELVRRQTIITTRLTDAGKDHKLSQARVAADGARAALHDKREQAWLHEATELLLGDVEQVYNTENEPEVLSRARALFREITANAFDLELDKGGVFFALDLAQQASRKLDELSSGTRMQLLLALRLAWIEVQEQGGETLPLFLDEALTTSDEERFAVMANSLERLAGAQGRQIFYLSARRHECALWKHATGNEPPIIDLAAVRFPQQAYPPQDYNITLPPSLPAPEGRDGEAYAAVLGVPLVNPRQEPGMVHLFHLLRDDLDLLHQFINNWRITSLGQLEILLDSNAGPAAVTDTELRERLRQRCAVVRKWTELWRQGRGRPVDRIVLQQSAIVSETFIDRVANLTETVGEDGEALVQALRAGQVSGFRTNKIDELESWLADEGYTDEKEILSADERGRLTLQETAPGTREGVEDVNEVLTWLESAIAAD